MKKYVAEFLGTFVLVFIGTVSTVLAGEEIEVLEIAFAFGIVILTMVCAIGPISVCHVYRAITVNMLLPEK